MSQEEVTQIYTEKYGRMILNKSEVAKELGISEASIDRMRKTGEIEAKKIGGKIMFNVSELSRMVSE